MSLQIENKEIQKNKEVMDLPYRKYYMFSILIAFAIGITAGYNIGKNNAYFYVESELDRHKERGGHPLMERRMDEMERRMLKAEGQINEH